MGQNFSACFKFLSSTRKWQQFVTLLFNNFKTIVYYIVPNQLRPYNYNALWMKQNWIWNSPWIAKKRKCILKNHKAKPVYFLHFCILISFVTLRFFPHRNLGSILELKTHKMTEKILFFNKLVWRENKIKIHKCVTNSQACKIEGEFF